MGFLKDLRNLQKQADAMVPAEHRGGAGGLRAMRDGVQQANAALAEMVAEGGKAQYLAAHGRIGTATIQAVRDTGRTINDSPTVELDLSVSVDAGPAYAVTHRQTISRIAIPSFQPGATVPVRVDPTDRSSLIIG